MDQRHVSGQQTNKRQRDAIESLIAKAPVITQSALSQLRYLILVEGVTIPDSADGQCPYRGYLWSILLRMRATPSALYVQLVQYGPSSAYTKIRNDTFRTLTSDKMFHSKVSEDALARVLNCFAWIIQKDKRLNQNQNHDGYVQGMNVLAAPFLYISRTEAQAFGLFRRFMTAYCPTYIEPTLAGVHTGLTLLDLCLKIIDPEVHNHLNDKLISSKIYGFASVLTFSACTPPLTELLVLWDFMFAYGCHMNILFVVAQLSLMRNDLLKSQSPVSYLRSFPPLRADNIIKLSVSYTAKLPDHLYSMLARHPYDPQVANEVQMYLATSNM